MARAFASAVPYVLHVNVEGARSPFTQWQLDGSNGYEAVAAGFIAGRPLGGVGPPTVAEWARALPRTERRCST